MSQRDIYPSGGEGRGHHSQSEKYSGKRHATVQRVIKPVVVICQFRGIHTYGQVCLSLGCRDPGCVGWRWETNLVKGDIYFGEELFSVLEYLVLRGSLLLSHVSIYQSGDVVSLLVGKEREIILAYPVVSTRVRRNAPVQEGHSPAGVQEKWHSFAWYPVTS